MRGLGVNPSNKNFELSGQTPGITPVLKTTLAARAKETHPTPSAIAASSKN